MLDYMWAIPLLLAPVGILLLIAIVVIALGRAATSSPEQGESPSGVSNLALMTGEPALSSAMVESPASTSESSATTKRNIRARHTRTLLMLNILASVLVVAATVVNVVVTMTSTPTGPFQLPPGAIAFFQIIPVFLVGWLLWLAWHTHKAVGTAGVGDHFLRLERVQRVVGIASIAWLVLMAMGSNFAGGLGTGIVVAAAVTPTLTGIVAMLVTWSVRVSIDESATEEGGNSDGK